MTIGKILLTDQTALIKFIERPSNNAYQDKKTIRLGLETIDPSQYLLRSPSGIFSLAGRATTISIEDAENVAHLIAEHIDAPVTVIKGLRVGIFEQSRVIDVDPVTHEERLKPGVTEDDAYVPVALEFTSIKDFRTVVEFLDDKHYISTSDRAAFNPLIKEIEDSVLYHDSLISTATPAQKDVVRVVAEPYVDDIIDLCADANSRNALLGEDNTWLDIAEPFDKLHKQAIARAILFGSCQGHIAKIFMEEFRGLQNGKDSATRIQVIYNGDSTLESTFKRMGQGVPRLEVQRAILAEFIEEKLSAKFGTEEMQGIPEGSNPELIKALRRRLFTDGYSLDMISIDSSKLKIESFGATVDAMEGRFGEQLEGRSFFPKHFWTLPGNTSIKGEAAKERFKQIRAEVEATLAPSTSATVSTTSTSTTTTTSTVNS